MKISGSWMEEIIRARGAFITGTDTGVGKTVVTAAIGLRLQRMGVGVGVFKPISTGGKRSEDGRWLKKALKLKEPLIRIAPVNFDPPVSPWVAAAMSRRPLPWKKIRTAYRWWRARRDVVLVEGVGGVLVPLERNRFVGDLIREFRLPTIVAARAGLGTINHTLLTLEALAKRRVNVLGVILNGATGRDVSEQTNARVIESCSGLPVLAILPYLPSLRRSGP